MSLHHARPGQPPMAAHTFTISTETPHWSRVWDVATCGPYRATSLKSCAARKLARAMMEAGEPDGPIEARGPDGRLHYTVRSLVAFGRTTIVENPRIAVAPHRDTPFPRKRNDVSCPSEHSDDE